MENELPRCRNPYLSRQTRVEKGPAKDRRSRGITPNDTPHYAPYIAFIIHEGGDGEKGKDDVVSGFHMRRRHVRVVGQSPLNDQLVIHMVEDHETTDDLRRLGDGRTKW